LEESPGGGIPKGDNMKASCRVIPYWRFFVSLHKTYPNIFEIFPSPFPSPRWGEGGGEGHKTFEKNSQI